MQKFLEWLGLRKKSIEAPAGVDASFRLKYGELTIGTLAVHDGVWTYSYSEDFRKLDQVRTIVEFPDPRQTYESRELWQFFASRIPSPEQPEVEEILKREHISQDDPIGLLRRFGRKTISNPFELEAA